WLLRPEDSSASMPPLPAVPAPSAALVVPLAARFDRVLLALRSRLTVMDLRWLAMLRPALLLLRLSVLLRLGMLLRPLSLHRRAHCVALRRLRRPAVGRRHRLMRLHDRLALRFGHPHVRPRSLCRWPHVRRMRRRTVDRFAVLPLTRRDVHVLRVGINRPMDDAHEVVMPIGLAVEEAAHHERRIRVPGPPDDGTIIRAPIPRSVDHVRVVVAHIHDLGAGLNNDGFALLVDRGVAAGGELAVGLRTLAQALDRVHHLRLLAEEGLAEVAQPL